MVAPMGVIPGAAFSARGGNEFLMASIDHPVIVKSGKFDLPVPFVIKPEAGDSSPIYFFVESLFAGSSTGRSSRLLHSSNDPS